MVSSGMLRRVALVRTDVSEEPGTSFIGVTRIGELGTTLVAASVVLTRATRCNIPDDTILQREITLEDKYNLNMAATLILILVLSVRSYIIS
jgi:hypothetical protein